MVKTKIEKAAFIGLGVMGYPMAGHLAKSGFSVMVYNRTKSKADRWVSEFGGRAAATPREAASGADIVFLCVGNDNDVRSVVYGEDGALAAPFSGTTQPIPRSSHVNSTKPRKRKGCPSLTPRSQEASPEQKKAC